MAAHREPRKFLPMTRGRGPRARLGRGRRRVRHRRRLRRSPAFAMAILGRVLEAAGFRVGDPQPARLAERRAWRRSAGRGCSSPSSAGNMDSMINHYTANRKVRNDDAYSPGGRIGLRPDRATLAYCQRAREAFPGVPVIAGGVEASLRRLAHYDYWSDKVRRSILLDCKADLRRLRHGRAARSSRSPSGSRAGETVQRPARHARRGLPARARARRAARRDARRRRRRCPSFEEVAADKLAFAEATQIDPQRDEPATTRRRLVQYHDRQAVVANPPALPITQAEMDRDLRPAVHAPAAPVVRASRSRPSR